MLATRSIREALPVIFSELKIRTLVDAPCGDANWIRHLDFPFDEYIGVDIVPELIERLKSELESRRRRFMVGDITQDVLPAADALLCRDCLIHLSYDLATAAVGNWSKAGFKYILTTTYPETQNRDIITGRWRPINMEAPPINFPPPMALIEDGPLSKSIGVWRAEEVFGPQPVGKPAASQAAAPAPGLEGAARERRHRGTRKELDKDEVKSRFARIKKLWADKNRMRAMALAEELYHDAPHNRQIANFLSWCLVEKRELHRALEVSAESFERFRHPTFLSRQCFILTRLQRGEEALRLTQSCFDDTELACHAFLFHGAVLLKLTDNFDSAVPFFHRAEKAGNLEADGTPARHALLTEEFEAFAHSADIPARNPIHFVSPRPSRPEAVVAVSADETYFRALFEAYSGTFLSHSLNPGHVLHAHIFDPSRTFLDEIADLERRSHGRILFSYEHTGGANRSYYYVGRFIQAPRLLARYDCPLLVTDIDCYFKTDLREILEIAGRTDLGIIELNRRLCPWRNFLAGMVVFSPAEAGRRFARAIQSFLFAMPADANYWYVDQLALVQCAYMSRNLGAGRTGVVTDAWRRLFMQGTGFTGQPEAKANRIRQMRSMLGEEQE